METETLFIFKMDILRPFFQLLYFISHFMYSLFQAVYNCCFELRSYVRQILWWNTYYAPLTSTLLRDAAELKKVPRHLVFLLISSQVTRYKQICHAINWGIGFGIRYFTFYDYKGQLKHNLASVINLIPKVHEDVTFKVNVDGNHYVFSHKILHIEKGITKESTTNIEIILNIYSDIDGKEDLVSVARQLCSTKDCIINISNISRMLIANEQPDPDLAIVIGKPLMTSGLLPWQIRLTEFVSLPSTSLLDYYYFKNILESYANCEQRFGR